MDHIFTLVQIVAAFILAVLFFMVLASLPLYLAAKHKVRSYNRLEDWIIQNNYTMRLPSFKKYKDTTIRSLFRKGDEWREVQRTVLTGRYTTKELLEGSSYAQGTTNIGFLGLLQQSKNKFLVIFQYERRGKAVLNRTVVNVSIPDTKLHMIINSKLNNDTAGGGNITNYTNAHRYQLESDFGKYFDVYMPDSTQAETLSILTPDTMLYILTNMHGFDIEIVGNKLFLYSYRHLKTGELSQMITHVDHVIGEARITTRDVKKSAASAIHLSRRVGASVGSQRKLKRFDRNKYYVIFLVASTPIMLIGTSIDIPLVTAIGIGIYLLLVILPVYQYTREQLRKRQFKKDLESYR